ncbi:MAG TPA: hypothetical protein H9851_07190 [Candidatus Borkfalkia faecavium]|uniref:Lipoyl-binding domain-containing protein n=1 Tax=Candidatus Borkfalkia faecavium TaxID=2838508 RepID=A0A9D1W1V8_9FIRM|nr:hypothetical protein [Candidatus Borkfalkia faecavium]
MRKFIITIEGKSYEVGVEEVGAEQSAAPVIAAPAAPAAPAAAPAAPVSGEKLLSPFPGLIKKFLVEEGASVKKDQPVLVLEAMKMDNDITAPCDGKISFKTAVGSNVETNTLLAVIG